MTIITKAMRCKSRTLHKALAQKAFEALQAKQEVDPSTPPTVEVTFENKAEATLFTNCVTRSQPKDFRVTTKKTILEDKSVLVTLATAENAETLLANLIL